MNKKYIILGVVIVVILAVALLSPKTGPYQNEIINDTSGQTGDTNTPVTTTSTSSTTTSGTMNAKIGQTITVFGVTGTVTELVEDSRCPKDTQCAQVGTVKVKIHFVYGALKQDTVLTLNQPFTMSGHSITLVGVQPDKLTTSAIEPSAYTFSFSVK